MTDASELRHPCPANVLQFAIDKGEDQAWTDANRARWNESAVLDVVRAALRRSRDALAGRVPVVCIGLAALPVDPVLERMGGIAGATVAPDLVALFVGPALNPAWLEDLPFTVAHEYHHTATWDRWTSGLDVLVREGRAHHFAWTLYPARLHPSARALGREQLQPAWRIIREHLDAPASDFTRPFMFGGLSNGNRVPGWAGYTIGYCLVWDYANRHPGSTPATLAQIPAQQFVVETLRCPD